MPGILLFEPVYQERVWGGRTLETAMGRILPGKIPVGESWEIVDRPEAQSKVRGGPLGGRTLAQILEAKGKSIMGPDWEAGARFPLLVKWLDCRERLSLQVHPTAGAARELGGESKTENWYVAHSNAGAQLLVGLEAGTTHDQFAQSIAENRADEHVRRLKVAVGDSILVRAGQVHAIDAGNLILEIQQNSDTTYRIHDWGRPGLDGKPRSLHVAESLRSIAWNEAPDPLVRASPTSGTIADCDHFTLRRVVLGAGETLTIRGGEEPRILSLVSGAVTGEKTRLHRGENALIPYDSTLTLKADAVSIVLLTEGFA